MLHGLSFGTWLKQRRRILDLTQADLAGYVGCSVDTIYRFESGARRPSKQVALRLASILNVDVDEIDAFLRVARAPVQDGEDDDYVVGLQLEHAPHHRSQLPTPTTPLIERTGEVTQICAQLRRPNVRLVTIVGLAGVGKTRLSLQVAHESLDMFTDGVFFVALDTISDPLLIGRAIAQTLDVNEQGTERIAESLQSYLRDREVLLVLDNFEQVLEGAELIADLLNRCPAVKVLVTSRERLRLWSEWVWDLEGLRFPPEDDASDLLAYGAVQLFAQRAQQVHHRWRLDAHNTQAVAHICRLVEGLPLAIELAASAVRERDCETIARDIKTHGYALAVAARDLPERHRSIWAALEHSWRLLADDEQRVLPSLAVFRSGWSLEAAEKVANASSDVLDSLAERSLVRHIVNADGTHRYSFHTIIRQYAEEKSADRMQFMEAGRLHLAFYKDMAIASELEMVGPDQKQWGVRLEREHDNMRAALRWAIEHGAFEEALAMAAALTMFWYQRGYWQEGREWLVRITSLSSSSSEPLNYGRALWSMATLADCQNDYDVAVELFNNCLTIFEALGDDIYVSKTFYGLANIACNRRDYEQAIVLYQRSLERVRPPNHHLEIGYALAGIGGVWLMLVDLDAAAAMFDESLMHFRIVGDKGAIASSLTFASSVARRRGDLVAARTLGEEALLLCRELEHKIGASWALRTIGTAALLAGNLDVAEQEIGESLLLRWDLRDKQGVAWGLEGFAEIATARHMPARAARLWAKAATLREEVGALLTFNEREELERCIAEARRGFDANMWNSAWHEGEHMRIEVAVAYALAYDERL